MSLGAGMELFQTLLLLVFLMYRESISFAKLDMYLPISVGSDATTSSRGSSFDPRRLGGWSGREWGAAPAASLSLASVLIFFLWFAAMVACISEFMIISFVEINTINTNNQTECKFFINLPKHLDEMLSLSLHQWKL